MTLLRHKCQYQDAGGYWTNLWKLPTTQRIKIFGWKLLHKRLPTFDRLYKWGLQVSRTYVLCGTKQEMLHHLFHNCDYTIQVWNRHLEHLTDRNLVSNAWQRDNSIAKSSANNLQLQALILTTFWMVWKSRNSKVFRGEHISLAAATSREALAEFRFLTEALVG